MKKETNAQTYKRLQKLLTNLIINCQSKDETRLHLCGYWHDEASKALTATDGHRLVSVASRYDERLKNVVINKNFEASNREPARVSGVFPSKYDNYCRITFPTFFKTYSKEKLKKEEIDSGYGRIYFNKETEQFETNKNDNSVFALNAWLIRELCDGHEYIMEWNGTNSPVKFTIVSQDYLIVMPLKM